MTSAIKKITPLLFVEKIEDCLEFWRERMGFEILDKFIFEDRLGYIMLGRENSAIMYQTRDCVRDDLPTFSEMEYHHAHLIYIQVEDILSVNDILQQSPEIEIIVPLRETHYGAREIFIRDPAGNAIAFAEHKD